MAYLTQLIIWSERQMNQVTYTHLIAKYNMNFIESRAALRTYNRDSIISWEIREGGVEPYVKGSGEQSF